VIIIRYGEIYLKSKPVRQSLEKMLESRIRWKLNSTQYKDRYKLVKEQHTFYLFGSFTKDFIQYIANTFGIVSVSPALQCQPTIPSINAACRLFREQLGNFTPLNYRVQATKDKRLSTSHYTMEYEASSHFKDWKVQLKNPAFTVYIDAREHQCFVFADKIPGPGGLPYGSQGKVVALLSSGIDSPVSAWCMGKRGCKLVLLHLGNDSLIRYKEILESWAGAPIPLVSIPFKPILETIRDKGAGRYQCIFCKKAMYLVAEALAKRTYSYGIVSGENLGQVASQTLSNLAELTSVLTIPIFRPLLTFDKRQIIDLARMIGTMDIYKHPDCKYVPSQPVTSISEKKKIQMNHLLDIKEIVREYIPKVLYD
jgi:thiamine biosynthesis protein ThiI